MARPESTVDPPRLHGVPAAGPDGREPGHPAAERLERDAGAIREMFGRVAPRYDLLNHLLSGWLDVAWRRRAARALELPPGSRVVDVCCGTGDQALALERRGHRVVAADFCLPMLALARRKYRSAAAPPAGLAGDALRLPLPGGRFDGATASFGLRNVADLDRALGEISRLLVPGGRVAILEFAVPRLRPLAALYLFYFRRLLPAVGRLLSADRTAYSYLPESVLGFPQRAAFAERMERAGLRAVRWRDLAAGIVVLYTGRRGGAPADPAARLEPGAPADASPAAGDRP